MIDCQNFSVLRKRSKRVDFSSRFKRTLLKFRKISLNLYSGHYLKLSRTCFLSHGCRKLGRCYLADLFLTLESNFTQRIFFYFTITIFQPYLESKFLFAASFCAFLNLMAVIALLFSLYFLINFLYISVYENARFANFGLPWASF